MSSNGIESNNISNFSSKTVGNQHSDSNELLQKTALITETRENSKMTSCSTFSTDTFFISKESSSTFADANVPSTLVEGMLSRGYENLNSVQSSVYKQILGYKSSIIYLEDLAASITAFLLPILANIKPETKDVQALILVSGKDCAITVADTASAIARYIDIQIMPVFGGVPIGIQAERLKTNPHIIVATPSRLLDHIRRGNVDLKNIKTIAVNDLGELLSMGISTELNTIFSSVEKECQYIFTAIKKEPQITEYIKLYTTNISEFLSEEAEVKPVQEEVTHSFYECSNSYPKARSLLYLLYKEEPTTALIICNHRDDVYFLNNYLNKQGLNTVTINEFSQNLVSNLKKGEHIFVLSGDQFLKDKDFSNFTHIINYSLPEDSVAYFKRIESVNMQKHVKFVVSLISGKDLTSELALQKQSRVSFLRKTLPTIEEANKLWTAKQLVYIRSASESTAFEGYIPMVKEMLKSLPEDEKLKLFATALRVFFLWEKAQAIQNNQLNQNDSTASDVEAPKNSFSEKESSKNDYQTGNAEKVLDDNVPQETKFDYNKRSQRQIPERQIRNQRRFDKDSHKSSEPFKNPEPFVSEPPLPSSLIQNNLVLNEISKKSTDEEESVSRKLDRKQIDSQSYKDTSIEKTNNPSNRNSNRDIEQRLQPPKQKDDFYNEESDYEEDPLEAFAAENNIDFKDWIDSEEFEENSSNQIDDNSKETQSSYQNRNQNRNRRPSRAPHARRDPSSRTSSSEASPRKSFRKNNNGNLRTDKPANRRKPVNRNKPSNNNDS